MVEPTGGRSNFESAEDGLNAAFTTLFSAAWSVGRPFRMLLKRIAAGLPDLPAEPRPVHLPGRQLQRRLTPDKLDELITAYKSGETATALAARYGVHPHTVTARLKRARVPLHQYGMTPEQIAEAERLYLTGQSLKQIGDRLGVDHTTVRRQLIQRGVAMRLPWERLN